ncbi:hypothetical protein ASE00_05745 [Sphingomonas sp. Root710]|uniref:hypothetical protein n=1 Tax=Sphingomonas sp. Root710 TaxID=1736594 RepID=UPI0006FB0D66|nr:hypothetical protein [Sphingomonas sp. Root710]KRB86232.1 hypothetical protein ASE00_05745 [Sphingomonas sp. Root710]
MKVAYFVHDLHDAAVARRVSMMQAAGLDPVILGFRRSDAIPTDIGGAPVVDLGRTADARLAQRAAAILRNRLFGGRIREAVQGCAIIVARNLESLILAVGAMGKRRSARLVYECLDIHRTLLGRRWTHRLIQSIERAYLRRIDLLITSSPAFLSNYFLPRMDPVEPPLLLENKVLRIMRPSTRPNLVREAGPPWTIGWLGMLRCRKSLEILTSLVVGSAGRIKVLIAGKPAYSEIEDFDSAVSGIDGLEYFGAYRPDDLAELYRRTHFTWAIDYFEEGLNSAWLLPNRLYEGSFHGSIPIALRQVETGAWLLNHNAGVLVDDPLRDLPLFFGPLDIPAYEAERARVDRIPTADLVTRQLDCDRMAAAMMGRAG